MWQKHDSVLYRIPSSARDVKTGLIAVPEGGISYLAGFDWDSTITYSSKGDKVPSDVNDWVWAYANTVEMLKKFRDLGWTIVIFSNRRGSPQMHSAAKKRMDSMLKVLGFDVWVFLATKDDEYRKPQAGMVALFAQLDGVTEWGDKSFFCGDAAGESKIRWNTWSNVDREFATASNLTFYEPHQRFAEFKMPQLDPKIKLVITVGQLGSGWDSWSENKGKTVPYGKDRRFLVSDSPTKTEEKDVIVLVYGSHPTLAEREKIKTTCGVTAEHTAIFWYARPNYIDNKANKTFISTFQPPTAYHRLN
jgi:DNA 3'-phosphatase